MMASFAVVAGSVAGRYHLLKGQGNQDAYAWRSIDGATVAVVCDGCGSGRHSEVGAALGSRLVVEAIHRRLPAPASPAPAELCAMVTIVEECLEQVRRDVLDHLGRLVDAMGGDPLQIITDFFLFAVVGAIITPAVAAVFALGDGLFAVDGALTALGPYAGNAPPYLAYELVPRSLAPISPDDVTLRIYAVKPAGEVRSILIGTDGVADLVAVAARPLPGTDEPVGPLAQFWSDDRYYRNPDAVRRRLARANRGVAGAAGLLPDDTTVLVLRRMVGMDRLDE